MKKLSIFALALLSILFSTIAALAVENQICGIGAKLLKDPYGKKTFILMTLPNSPAQNINLPIGAEILEVNSVKTKKYGIDDIQKMIIGNEGTKVNLLIKYNGKKTNYEITRAKVNIPQIKKDKIFDLHWEQVVPEEYKNAEYISSPVFDKVCRDYRALFVIPNNYWAERKVDFKKGYNACISYPKTEQNMCLMNLVNREMNKTNQYKQALLQQQIVRQQAIQNFTNNMNQINTNTQLQNINNNLQQQNFQLQNTNYQLQNINNNLMW